MKIIKITYYNSGNIKYKIRLLNGALNKKDGQVCVVYYDNIYNNIKGEIWAKNGTLNRIDGPAVIEYNIKGMVITQRWYVNGTNIKNHPKKWPLTREQQITFKLIYL